MPDRGTTGSASKEDLSFQLPDVNTKNQ